ncbi:Lipoxygenase [Terfezia boudieri ATCC MYA-4762]|uniref:Manganese lipoxygenase n=1 Tax=Terfezia boudieri ATCC MYA-4762 TaxID=1051890 RepID=A0A3N4LQ33_9PEZI|nr:Lipoxygenase [Terfezia boudieri ATCC MYA-4762]
MAIAHCDARLNHVFDIVGFQPMLPEARTLKEKQELYDFQLRNSDNYPPHLEHIPTKDEVDAKVIFNKAAYRTTALILLGIWTHWTTPDPIYKVKNIDEIIEKDRKFRSQGWELFADTNIGDRDDWFSDEVFAQQQFTGVNPVSITIAAPESLWVINFKAAATTQKRDDVLALIDSPDSSLYVADYSYFRKAIGALPEAELSSGLDDPDNIRYGCSPVGLFNLTPEGKLHPVGIIIDYKASMENSVTIFNRSLTPGGRTTKEQKEDWPWRYAKTALSSADWLHHEAKVHLTDTHLVEEVIIVATHRAFQEVGAIYNLLEPHWERTLSLNKAARDTLVPSVITKIAGVRSKDVYTYIRYVFENFDFVGGYIPNDLEARGFPLDKLDDPKGKFHNYAYARNMKLMWMKLRKFVCNYMSAFPEYDTNEKIAQDPEIAYWCSEINGPLRGNLKSFPTIKTREQLIDALTMCIHIASPQHTAINYLQRYYMSLVINKPPAFCKPLPDNLITLKGYGELQLFDALPIRSERAQEYMLASHLPWLLSYQVASEQNLINYAITLKNLSTGKVHEAAKEFEADLNLLKKQFDDHNAQLDDEKLEYSVMDPELTAVSILI